MEFYRRKRCAASGLALRRPLVFHGYVMRLLTAHRILIFTAIVFFGFFSLWELRNYDDGAGGWAMLRAILYLLVAVGFGIYFKSLKRLFK